MVKEAGKLTYITFLLVTLLGASIIMCWLTICWAIVTIIYGLWGWPGVFFLSWAASILIFFQGTRIAEWIRV